MGRKGLQEANVRFFALRQMAPRFPHDSNALLRRVRGETLHGSGGQPRCEDQFRVRREIRERRPRCGLAVHPGWRDQIRHDYRSDSTPGRLDNRREPFAGSCSGFQIQISKIIVGFPIGVGFG